MKLVGDKYILPGKEDHDRLRTISELHDERTHALLRRAGFAGRGRFVEFGCGLGYVTRWAATEGADATGIDVNEDQVEACRDLAREAGLKGATFRTGSPSAAYDEVREIALAAGLARGVDYTGGRRAHTWAKEAGFEIVHVDAYHPHFIEGRFKGFWNWTLRNVCRRLLDESAMTPAHWQRLVDGMTAADDDRGTVVAHCRMHQVIARKPV